MSVPITSVTENRVTITANDTEENIRAAAGFAEPETKADETTESPVEGADTPAELEKADDAQKAAAERNPDGTFKKPEAKKKDGDPRLSHQAKINRAIAAQRDAERRAEEAERRAAAHEAELHSLRQPKPTPPQTTPASSPYQALVQKYQSLPDAPKWDEFASFDDPYASYQVAMGAFIADQRYAEQQAKAEQERSARQRVESTTKAIDLAEEAHPGLRDQLLADTRVYPPAVLQLLAEESASDPHFSADLLHHLLTHPDDAERLARCASPTAAAREVGRLSERLSAASSGPETTATYTTTAKPLIKPVSPSVMAKAESTSLDDLPFSQYMKTMNERERKAKGSRTA